MPLPRAWQRALRPALLVGAVTAGLVVLPSTPAATSAVTTRVVATRATQVSGVVRSARTFSLSAPATTVAVLWRGRPDARVELRLGTVDGRLAPAVSAGRDELGAERHDGTTYGALHTSAGAAVSSVLVSTDRPLPRLTVLGLSDRSGTTSTTRTAPGAAEAATTQPPVEARAQWGADPALMTWAPQFYDTKKLVVHHTATSNDYADRAGAEAQIRSIYYYHSVTQGWGDIGYNFLIDKFGTIYEGRYSRDYAGANPSGDDTLGRGVTGAHTSGWNSGTVGIALLGTMTTADATVAARQSLEDLLAWEASRHGIDPLASDTFVNPVSGATTTTPNIAGHRDYAATECPGDAFYATLPQVRQDVAARIAGGTSSPDTTAPSAPAGLSATGARGSVSLSWSAATDDVGVTGYQVWRRRSGTSSFALVATSGTTTFVDSGLKRRVGFTYRVRATDAAGNLSGWSPTASATTT